MVVHFYTLASTRDLSNIRYLGKTVNPLSIRLSQHLNDAKRKLKEGYTHNYRCNWINKEIREGYNIVIEEIDCIEDSTNTLWQSIETMWIGLLRSWGFKLVNLTNGGEGVSGLVQSEESNRKRSIALLGTYRPEEVKQKIAKTNTGKVVSDETKQKIKQIITELQGRRICQFNNITGEFIKEWESIKEAATFYNTDPSNIMNCCKNKNNRTTAVGYIWKYKEDNSEVIIDKSKYIYCIYPNKVIECVNQKDAIDKTGVSKNSIIDCLKKRKESCKGIKFLHYEEYINSKYTSLKLEQVN